MDLWKDPAMRNRTNKLRVLTTTLSLLLTATFGAIPSVWAAPPEIHCIHFFHGYPLGAPETNDLIIRDIYALSSNDTTKFADWVVYRLDKGTVFGETDTCREWRADPFLDDDETLEPGDYSGASEANGIDRGHQAPLASFKGTSSWWTTNYLSNITPQKKDLNQGPWQTLEQRVRDLVVHYDYVWVMTGPLYKEPLFDLVRANEPHTVPSHYWKIICVQEGKSPQTIKAAAFLFHQNTPRDARILDHLTTIDDIEQQSGLDFLRELPDDLENRIESDKFEPWAGEHFQN